VARHGHAGRFGHAPDGSANAAPPGTRRDHGYETPASWSGVASLWAAASISFTTSSGWETIARLAGRDLDRRRPHALGELALGVGRDGLVARRDHVPRGLGPQAARR